MADTVAVSTERRKQVSYTQQELEEMPIQHLLNIITSVCDSGVPEYLQEMRACKAELARRGLKMRLIQVESTLIPGKIGYEAVLVEKKKAS